MTFIVMMNYNQVPNPPPEKGSICIRPLLMGSGRMVGVYASPLGNYFKVGTLSKMWLFDLFL